jgi:isocitrate lyase
LRRADEIAKTEGDGSTYWYAPIVADAEAGFGGPLNAFELMKGMIEAGAAGVHFEDQLSSEKKCGHLGGKVLVPTSQFLRTLIAARLLDRRLPQTRHGYLREEAAPAPPPRRGYRARR